MDGSTVYFQDTEARQFIQVWFQSIQILLEYYITLYTFYSICSIAEIEASEVDILTRPACSNPVNMPDSSEMPIQGLPFITGEGSSSKRNCNFFINVLFLHTIIFV